MPFLVFTKKGVSDGHGLRQWWTNWVFSIKSVSGKLKDIWDWETLQNMGNWYGLIPPINENSASWLFLRQYFFCQTIFKPGSFKFHHWRSLYQLISQTLILQNNAIFGQNTVLICYNMATMFKICTDLYFGLCWTK